ncbi:sugar phosphate isomerase/epimerase [Tamaricihabitans halophyticus]|uniref:Sugar phosphate isomerase/epimerase n=1 Tax=Tamaricihabitans halophyticus TaxID=1262583 RepID=A0A4R2R2S2_9PSEU|nr:sugar phosphate isomerase/epimerase [Tamaricihabitans halophyticus]TCP56104.1 sugar phosphate isomerase/epimerase [Tamaricihabitans halophyticus]
MSDSRLTNSQLSRRTALRGLLAGTVAAGALAGSAGVAAGSSAGWRRIPRSKISIQLYTLRTLLEHDVEDTLRELAAIGYRKVEMAGTYGYSAAEFRELLDKHGLRATSSHVGIDDGPLDSLVEDAQTLGNQYVAVPFADFDTIAEWRTFADQLTEAAKAFRAAGIRFGYHNHDHEFREISGTKPFDVIAECTDPRLVYFELDLFWAVDAGEDPVELFRGHFPRVRQYHVKDRTADGEMVDPGAGVIDFPGIFRATQHGRLAEYIVEHDEPTDPLGTARAGYEYLANLRW